MSNELKMKDVEQLTVRPGANIIATVDTEMMSRDNSIAYMEAIANRLRVAFPDNQVIVVPSSVKISISDQDE